MRARPPPGTPAAAARIGSSAARCATVWNRPAARRASARMRAKAAGSRSVLDERVGKADRARRAFGHQPSGDAIGQPLRDAAHAKGDGRHTTQRRFHTDHAEGLGPAARDEQQVAAVERPGDVGLVEPPGERYAQQRIHLHQLDAPAGERLVERAVAGDLQMNRTRQCGSRARRALERHVSPLRYLEPSEVEQASLVRVRFTLVHDRHAGLDGQADDARPRREPVPRYSPCMCRLATTILA